MTLELKKFDMRNISFKPDENKGPVIVLIGRRDTGKIVYTMPVGQKTK
jgi:uncharacterized FlaG/YvyC family protein